MNSISNMVNIVKIKDSIFIGDISAGTNRDLIEEFKISHIINSTNNLGLNSLEYLNIKYLNLNWAENSKQQLFETGDENVFKIMNFIDNADKNGEGLLIFSIRGQDRCCIVVIIFLMKKYNWCVNKCIDFMMSKKINVYIPNYFLSQLNEFEIRMNKFSKIKKSINWNEEQNNRDFDESIMRNTYVNTLPIKNNINNNNNTNITIENESKKNCKIIWKDKNNNNINDLVTINLEKDLFYKKNINPIKNHMLMKPKKSCMKKNNKNDEEEIKENEHINKTKSNDITMNKENNEIKIRPLKSAKKPKINNTFNKINNQFQKNTFLNNIINQNSRNNNNLYINDINNSNNSNNNIYIQESYKPEFIKENKKKNLKNVNIFLKINTNNNNFIKPYESKIPFGIDSTKLGLNNFLKDYSSINIGKDKVLLNHLGLNYNYFSNNNFMYHSPTNNNLKPFVKKRNLLNTILNKKQNFSFSKQSNSYNQVKLNNPIKRNSFISTTPDSKKPIIKKKLTFENEEINNSMKRPSTANEQNKFFKGKKTKVYPKLLKRPTSPMIRTFNDNNFLSITSNNDNFPKNPSLPNSLFGLTIENFLDLKMKKFK